MKIEPWMTKVAILAAVVLLIVWEIIALSPMAQPESTISEVIWSVCGKGYHVMIPFAAGILCGHLFWQRCSGTTSEKLPSRTRQG